MNFTRQTKVLSKILFGTIILSGLLLSASCKKDKKSAETLPYMSGYLDFYMPQYTLVGKRITVTGNSVVSPESGVTYCWYAKGILSDTVKGSSVTFTVPDSIATFTVQYIAKCKGYTNSSRTHTITSVDPKENGSIKNVAYTGEKIVDARDNSSYNIVKIGNLLWFAQNLNYKGAGHAYFNDDAAGDLFGRYYTWNEATGGESRSGLGNGPQGVCPEGWSIPTNEDWIDLAKVALKKDDIAFVNDWIGAGDALAVSATFNGSDIWPFSGVATPLNTLKWNALAAGYSTNNGKNFYSLFEYGFWWSSTEKDANNAYYRYIYYNQTGCPVNNTSKGDFGASVRCVKKADTAE